MRMMSHQNLTLVALAIHFFRHSPLSPALVASHQRLGRGKFFHNLMDLFSVTDRLCAYSKLGRDVNFEG